MDRGKPDIHDDFERCDANDSDHFSEETAKSSKQPLPEVSRDSALVRTMNASEDLLMYCHIGFRQAIEVETIPCATCQLPQGVQTLGQYMVGKVLTRKETIFSWIGVAVMFFVVMIPTVNQTILAYFTTEVRSCLLRGATLLDLPYQCDRPQACVPHMLAPARTS